MSPALFLARAQLRRRWRALMVVAIVGGLVTGIVASLVAGSRRTASVVDRYFAQGIPYDYQVFAPALSRADIAALPGVRRVDASSYVGMNYVRRHRSPDDGINGMSIQLDAIDPTFRLLSGRRPRPDELMATLVNPAFVGQFHLREGDNVRVQMFGQGDADAVARGDYRAHGPKFTFHIVGVVRTPDDVAIDEVHSPSHNSYNGGSNGMLLSARFYQEHRRSFLDFGASYDVQLASPHERPNFLRALRAAGDAAREQQPPGAGSPRFSARRAAFDTPVGFESTTLAIIAAAVALGGALVVALLLRAEERAHTGDMPVLAALGWSSRTVRAAAALRAVPGAVLAVLLAMATTVALSPLYPIGVGGELEPDRGVHVDAFVVAAAGVVLAVLFVGLAVIFTRVGTRAPRSAAARRGSLTTWVAGAGAPIEVVVGTHFAFERRRAPARRAMIAGAVALLLVVGIGVFTAGIDRLYTNPRAHGYPWDAVVGNVNFDMPGSVMRQVTTDHRIARHTFARDGDVRVNGRPTELLAFDGRASAPPLVLSGRIPGGPDEIALGNKSLDELHLAVGATVHLSLAGGGFDRGTSRDRTLKVVGVALAPVLGSADFGKVSLASLDVVRAAGGITTPQVALVRVRGSDRAATVRALAGATTAEIATDIVPARVVNLHRVRRLPLLGGALAAVLGIVLLAYTLTLSAAARRRDLAVLRVLGLSTRRVRRALQWQGVVLAVVIVVVGVPLGLFAGVITWRLLAQQLGVGDAAPVPSWLALVAPAVLVVAVLASVVPTRRVLRRTIGTTLRVE